MLGKTIKSDIQSLSKKELDINLIVEEKRDLTFFDIDEEENNETLKALKQSYVTTNYKDETILNLQNSIGNNEASKEIKLKSYKEYNNALDLANKNYITSAIKCINKAVELNPKDVDILNLRGLLRLLKCDFSKAFESFYTGLCYGNNELSRKYVDILSENDFKVFLGRYNHAIRFINEDLNQESIYILDNIIEEDEELIEPYVILSLLYDKLGDIKKRDSYIEKLKAVDKDNEIIENNINESLEEESVVETNKKPKKINMIYVGIIVILLSTIFVFIKINNNKMNELNEELKNTQNELDNKNDEIDDINKELENSKDKETEVILVDEEELYFQALDEKKSNNTDEAIKKFENILEFGKSGKFKGNSTYQLAIIYEELDDYDNAVKYYSKYIKTYNKKEVYYDDACYQLGMLYYNNDDLYNAKETFKFLRKELPDSMYNNSTIEKIINE